jgi:hypothetical protein
MRLAASGAPAAVKRRAVEDPVQTVKILPVQSSNFSNDDVTIYVIVC